ncbi:MAG: hypothetical protein LH478_04590 [Chitinophagaceae bacterium]|nr:hypothetical protein [Chitinophagaceae bacterium]
MKNIWLFLIGTLLLSVVSNAQENKGCCQQNNCRKHQQNKPVISKGYYAIGNNAQKLATNSTIPIRCDSIETSATINKQTVTKGYYSIADNNNKLLRQQQKYTTTLPSKVGKGYYAIGDNHKKLKNTHSYVNGCCICDCR